MTMTTAEVTTRNLDSIRRRSGWRIVARKELSDHLLSARFAILLMILVLAGLAAVNSAADNIREAASAASGTPSVFLLLFTVAPDRIPSYLELIGFLGPLLGIGFGFDAINSERSSGTLARLVSQPIHRDDIITGKFAAGIALIAIAISTLTAIVAGYGIVQLGITPDAGDTARLVTFVALAVVYVAAWLAFAILVSVLVRRASTGILACLGPWLVLTLFAGLITGAIADLISPVGNDGDLAAIIENARTELTVSRVSPEQLYDETATVLLNPQIRSTGIISVRQLDQAVPDALPWGQSMLLVWPYFTALFAAIVVIFCAAFVLFMRQEVRA